VGLVGGGLVVAQRHLGVDGDDALVRQTDDEVGTQAASFLALERFLEIEVAELGESGELDAALERALAPRAAHGRRLQGVGEAGGLVLRGLLRAEEGRVLLLQAAVRFDTGALRLQQRAAVLPEHVPYMLSD